MVYDLRNDCYFVVIAGVIIGKSIQEIERESKYSIIFIVSQRVKIVSL